MSKSDDAICDAYDGLLDNIIHWAYESYNPVNIWKNIFRMDKRATEMNDRLRRMLLDYTKLVMRELGNSITQELEAERELRVKQWGVG